MRCAATDAIFLFLVFCAPSFAQVAPPAVRVPPQRDRVEADLQRRMNDMRALDQKMRPGPRELPNAPAEPKLTAEERSRVLKLRHVAAADIETYSALLREEHTGIFKLFPDFGCESRKVIQLAGDCERYVPLSSSFTFRTNNYGDEIYHDIHFKDGKISSTGFFSQGIFAAVGDDPIESIGLTHPILTLLNSFPADTDSRSAAEHAREFVRGVDQNGHQFVDNISPKENTTYVVRVIAYRLENGLKPLSADSTMNEMLFHSLEVDKRLDVIVAFRILGRDDSGAITIVWKELARTEAPKIKFTKNQPMRDFRQSQNQ